MQANISHIIVLMLENRSFDHMLGYLQHPDSSFPPLTDGDFSNIGDDIGPFDNTSMAGYQLAVGPGHHHSQVKQQTKNGHSGYVLDYQRVVTKQRKRKNKELARVIQFKIDNGPTHTWAYPKLWKQPGNNYRSFERLNQDINDSRANNTPLPSFSFVEPNHGLNTGPFFRNRRNRSNNQHPGNNIDDIRDFVAGEKLLADIYGALTANPWVFERTFFLITYDEHGGFFDHVSPTNVTLEAPDEIHRQFDFKTPGVRVPAVLISPWIAPASIDDGVYEHT